MLDIEKHVSYWRDGAREDWDAAQDLVRRGKTRHGLFFAHLALEKSLKALVCRKTGAIPPHIHNLVRLAEMAGLTLDDARRDTLADMNAFNVEGRYPETMGPLPGRAEAEDLVRTYLRAVRESGIPVRFGVLFGSWASGSAGALSDIDVVVVSPRFDDAHDRSDVNQLWRLAARTDSRIEPIACGERQWAEDDSTPIIEVARLEGRQIDA